MAGTLIEFLPGDNGKSSGFGVDAELRAERVVGVLADEIEGLLALETRAFQQRAETENEAIAHALESFLAHRARETAFAARSTPRAHVAGRGHRPTMGEGADVYGRLDRAMLLMLVRLAHLPVPGDRMADAPPATATQLLDVAAVYGLSDTPRAAEVISCALARRPALAAELADALNLAADLVELANQAAASYVTSADNSAEAGLFRVRDAAFTLHALAACHPEALRGGFLPSTGPPSELAAALGSCYDRVLASTSPAVAAQSEVAGEARAHTLLLFAHALGATGSPDVGARS
eukprot:CAMPEP_0179897810 /NCGR_PEP_ID=MMETSP0982-20121206/37232_1 /TAXON_ID=483367 /ORGANISM="non described non described, Strain CCMP 2436" /LENGTH=292 /DNA_ID=CAMNT_0021794921 /DNA_START=11 /DNA_END=886 /DNA_ORIENTATION=-